MLNMIPENPADAIRTTRTQLIRSFDELRLARATHGETSAEAATVYNRCLDIGDQLTALEALPDGLRAASV